MTHDYTRNGVTTWFAALTRLTGPVRSMTEGRASGLPLHRHQAWRRFLKMIDRQTPKYKERHLIGDDYATGRPRATHPHPEVKAWLAKHLRFHRHFPPTLPGSTGSSASFATSHTRASAAAGSTAWRSCKAPSTTTSPCTMPSRSSEPLKPATSSPSSPVLARP